MKFKPSLRSGKSFRTPTKLDFLKKPPDRGLIAPDFMPVKPVTAEESEAFKARGGAIDYCQKRQAEQVTKDATYGKKLMRNPLIAVVEDYLFKRFDIGAYLDKQRQTVRDILDQPRNAISNNPNASKHARRHQRAIHLVNAMAFRGMTQSDYYRRYSLKKQTMSDLLKSFCKHESGLAEALRAISSCRTVIFLSQAGQSGNDSRKWESVSDGRWLYSPSYGRRYLATDSDRDAPKSEPASDLVPIEGLEPFKPFDLHEPKAWAEFVYWQSLHDFYFYGPARPPQRFEPLPNRYREISRSLLVKTKKKKEDWWNHKEEEECKKKSWEIARAFPITDLDSRTKNCPQRWTYTAPTIWDVYEIMAADQQQVVSAPREPDEGDDNEVVRVSPKPMCNPTRWIRLPHTERTGSKIVPVFTKRNWLSLPVKDHKKVRLIEASIPLYAVQQVTTSTGAIR